jgi:iron complex outermembrane receptor protein
MNVRIPLALACTASLFSLIQPAPAFAQADQPAASSGNLEEIVVTARRKEEKLQSVPVAITAFTPSSLEEKHIESASDLAHHVPGLASSQETRDEQVFYLRGQGPNGGQGGAPGVVTYFAEVPFYASGPGIYFDLDNLQVLRGPQGTLFGRNTTGGAVLFEPKRPTNNFEGYLQASFGDYNLHAEEGAINIPVISDQLMIRAAFSVDQRDGFTHDYTSGKDLDNRDYWSFRLGVTWRPTDDFENYIVYDSLYSHTNGTGIELQAINSDPTTAFAQTFCPPGPGPCALEKKFLNEQAAVGPRGTFSTPGLGGLDKTYSYGITDIATYDLTDNVKVKNIFGYRVLKNLLRYDLDAMPVALIDFVTPNNWNLSNSQYSDEIQLQGTTSDGSFNWIAGGFGEFLHPSGYTVAQLGTTSSNPALPGVLLPVHVFSNSMGQNALGPEGITERTQAVFLQGTYNLGNLTDMLEGLKFTAGVRYTWDYTSNSNFETVDVFLPQKLPPGFPPGLGGLQIAHQDCVTNPLTCTYRSHQFQAPTWTVGLDYQIDPNTLVYVKSSRGFKSGGFNGAGNQTFPIQYESEYVTDVEIGLKADWDIDGVKLRTNVDGFHDDYRNAQRAIGVLVQTVPTPGAPKSATTVIANGDATIEGTEFEGTVIPFKDLEMTASWSYTHARYDKFLIPQGIGLPSLNERDLPYPFTPKNKFGFSGRYHLPFVPSEDGDLSVQASYVHTGRIQYSTADIEPYGSEPGYGLVDLNVDWTDVMGQPFDVSFFMSNVTDTLAKVGNVGIYKTQGYVDAIYNEPQMWGFRVKYRFGGPAEEPAAPAAAYVPPPAQAPAAPHSYLVFFDFNKSDLTTQATQIVDQAASNAGPAKVTRLTVTGHTDTVGSDAYNMRLSRRRAESVAARLEKDGIPSSEIAIVAKGKRDLLVPTADGVREPQNRRVQIVYDGTAGM